MKRVCVCLLLVLAVSCSTLISQGRRVFPEIDVSSENYKDEACAPLNDVWGFDTESASFAVVGASNGVAIVDVTSEDEPFVVSFPYVGCITEWRDMKVYQNYLYVVNDYTTLCDCSEDQQPCQQELLVVPEGASDPIEYRAVEGHAQAPLSDFPDGVSGYLRVPADSTACSPIEEDLSGFVALIDRGNCTFTEKTLNAQMANATGVVIVDIDQEAIYPSMSGNNTGINIPGLLIGSTDGEHLKSYVSDGDVLASLNQDNRANSTLYNGPDGWYILDISDPTSVSVVQQTNDFFDFAHNILIDPLDRPLAYVCGQSSNSFEDIGGVLVFDLTDPINPQLIANFSTAYIHDIEVVRRDDDQVVLYGCAIYDGELYVIDVTDPWNNPDLNNQVISVTETIESPHNTAQTEDGLFLYVTHEEFTYPVTIWDSSDLTNITYVSQFSVNAEQGTSPHNAMVDGEQLWMSYYSEGVLVYDITDPTIPAEIGQKDTSDYESGFHGVWGIYPYSNQEDVTYASDIESGLWVLKLVGEEDPSATPIPSPSVSASASMSFGNSQFNSSLAYTNSNSTATGTDTEGGFPWEILLIVAAVIVVIIFIIAVVILGFILYKKRVAYTATAGDEFDGRVDDDDDLF